MRESGGHDSDKLTVVVIPGHGGSMFQWRLSPLGLGLLLLLVAALLGGAFLVLTRDLKQRHDLARASELKDANLRVAADLARGREALLRVPGLGVKAVDRILATRRWRRLRLEDVARLTVSVGKVRPFLVTEDWRPVALSDRADLRPLIAPKREQLELFAA